MEEFDDLEDEMEEENIDEEDDEKVWTHIRPICIQISYKTHQTFCWLIYFYFLLKYLSSSIIMILDRLTAALYELPLSHTAVNLSWRLSFGCL